MTAWSDPAADPVADMRAMLADVWQDAGGFRPETLFITPPRLRTYLYAIHRARIGKRWTKRSRRRFMGRLGW